MAAGESEKGLFGGRAMRQIGLQQLLDGFWRILRLEVVIDLLSHFGIGTKTSAREQMIALDGVLLANRYLGGDQADIADVMLGAGMVAAGHMDVERGIDLNPRLAPVAD